MRENIRSRQQPFQLSLTVKQASAALVAALLVVGAAFALGLGVGRRSSAAPARAPGVAGDALARLDEPIAAHDEPPPELKAHQALTDSRSIDKTMPVPTVTAVAKAAAAPAPPRAEEKGAPEPEIVMPPPIAAPGPAPLPAGAGMELATSGATSNPTSPSTAASNPTANATPTATKSSAIKTAGLAPDRPRAAKPAKSAPAKGSTSAALRSRSSTKGAYTIQIASVHSRADAERAAKGVAARKPRIVAADVPGKGRWYRVQVGSYESRESARLALLSMSGVHGIVTPAR